ncbi:DUF2232 domain-containing protein [Pseudochelatococcus contaminans]|uniref:DUF2232 domain-containing protein n=1 Tax=Pseudochelatococcus contaminans TaxID=1538103 RepID=A0A7W5Z4L2_9HYPH|nr:DUF2232 domain-containing protein [Pseudochelatococcus contaminans]MBB3809997.1 hypothetical protein [Pseudochelatococcus contaminans]
MAMILLIGTGAGLVSALLFGVVATMSLLAMLLSYIAPLPILIAALGWNHRSGLVAAIVGSLVCAIFLAPAAGAVFAIAVGAPAWWLAYLALLGRSDAAGNLEWYPLGRLLVWIAATATLITLIGAIALGPSFPDYRNGVEEMIRAMIGSGPTHPDEAEIATLVSLVAAAVPLVAATTFTYMLTINLWIAAYTVRVSDRLPRQWPSIPETLLPREALIIVAFAAIGTAILPGYSGLAATAALGGMGAALSLQGLASIHLATRGNRARPVLLAILYASLLLLSVWVVAVLAIVGALAVALRQRAGAPKPPSSR